MTKLDLAEISPELAELYKYWLRYTYLIGEMGSDPTVEQLSRASKADGKIAQQAREYTKAIAATMLKLAEENEQLKKEIELRKTSGYEF